MLQAQSAALSPAMLLHQHLRADLPAVRADLPAGAQAERQLQQLQRQLENLSPQVRTLVKKERKKQRRDGRREEGRRKEKGKEGRQGELAVWVVCSWCVRLYVCVGGVRERERKREETEDI